MTAPVAVQTTGKMRPARLVRPPAPGAAKGLRTGELWVAPVRRGGFDLDQLRGVTYGHIPKTRRSPGAIHGGDCKPLSARHRMKWSGGADGVLGKLPSYCAGVGGGRRTHSASLI